jgi:hypothetical protein
MLHILIPLGICYGLWIHFLAVMNLMQARDEGKLPVWANRLGMPILIAGVLIDVFAQFTIACVVFLELPRELTVSGRVKRWVEGPRFIGYPDGGPPTKGIRWWRFSVALWMRVNLLKPFDRSGGHG